MMCLLEDEQVKLYCHDPYAMVKSLNDQECQLIKNNSEQSQQRFTCIPKQGVEQLINAGVIPDDTGMPTHKKQF
nr:hypothetical protein [Tanacetum cinerariifolium]